jgi:hypothetical protein
MRRKFNYGEVVVLNPLQSTYDLMPGRVLVPLYAATNDGIYRINRRKRLGGFAAVVGITLGIIFFAFVAVAGILLVGFTMFSLRYPYVSPPYLSAYLILGLIGGGLIAGSVYAITKLVKAARKFGRIANTLEGELIVPWNSVKTIVGTNVRQENVANSVLRPVFKEIGDWRVMTANGREITIPFVDDPFNKLNYVKTKYNLILQ